MYQLNMIKGRQLPDNNWSVMVVTGVAFILPIVLGFVISIGYFDEKASLNAYQGILTDYEFQLREMEVAKKRVDKVASANEKKSARLGDVGEVLLRHTQWTDILMAISNNLPESLQVNKLNVMRKSLRKTVDQRYGSAKKINISMPARTLVVSLYSAGMQGDDAAVRKLQRSLLEAEAFRKRVTDVVIASREPDIIDGQDVVRYELNCIMNSN